MNIYELKEYLSRANWANGVALAKNGIKYEIRNLLESLTCMLPDQTITSRGWHIINDIYDIQQCLTCKAPVKWDKSYKKYPSYCSNKCTANSSLIKEKKKKTSLEKYGNICSFQNEQIIKQIEQNNLERYGVVHASQRTDVKEKKKKTNLDRRGVEYSLSDKSVREQIKKTNLKKYGTEYVSQNAEIQERIKNTNVERYGVAYVLQSPEIQERIKNTNLERYGTEIPSQSDIIKLKTIKSNKEKYNVEHINQKHISQEALIKLNDKDWLFEQHHKNKRLLQDIATTLSVHPSTVGYKMKQFEIDIINYTTSSYENEIIAFLQNFDIEFKTNVRNVISPYELDIFLEKDNLAIEINGLYWHSEVFKDKNYHKNKYDLCKNKNIKLLQIFEDEWLKNKEIIKKNILYLLKVYSEPVYARKCNIRIIGITEKKNFLELHHIQGNGAGSINFGLEYENKIVACITFIKQNNEFILNRYATSCNVPGGFSKLLTHFERKFNNPKIVTFADLRWSDGDLYKINGFTETESLPIDYAWSKRTDRFHKFNFRHDRMKNKLQNYDKNLSETENMHNHGFNKIWDCGKLRFVKNG